MKNKYLTGNRELSCLIINLIIYKVFTDAPRRFINAGPAAFLSALISAGIAYTVLWFLPVIYKKAGAKSIFELLKSKGLAMIAGLIVIVWILMSSSYALEALVSFSKLSAFPNSPFSYIAAFFVIAFSVATLKGIHSCTRPNGIIIPFVIFVILMMLLAVARYFDVTNLMPMLGKGLKETFFVSVKNLSYFFDFVLIFLINPFIKEKDNLEKNIRYAGGVGILINLLIILSINLLIPYPASAQIEFPVYQILKNVYFGRFFQRIDALYLFAVSLSGMCYLSYALFLLTYIFKSIFNTEKNRVFVWSFSFLILFISMLINKGESLYIYDMLVIFEVASILLLVFIPVIFMERKAKK